VWGMVAGAPRVPGVFMHEFITTTGYGHRCESFGRLISFCSFHGLSRMVWPRMQPRVREPTAICGQRLLRFCFFSFERNVFILAALRGRARLVGWSCLSDASPSKTYQEYSESAVFASGAKAISWQGFDGNWPGPSADYCDSFAGR